MTRPVLVLALLVTYVALAFGLRTYLHYRRTGSSGFRGISGHPISASWLGGVLFLLALVGSVAAPVLAVVELDPALGGSAALDVLGGVSFAIGVALLLWSQGAMGSSWRIGVDDGERTTLVTGGPFGVVRNPIFSSMLLSGAGFVLLLPNIAAITSYAMLLAAIELQVRFVEEPYLRRTHGASYDDYTDRVGRFVPGMARWSRR